MALNSLGDMASHFTSLRHNTAIKARMDILTRELSTGKVADLALHLGDDGARLLAIRRSFDSAAGFATANRNLSQALSAMQVSLAGIESERAALSGGLMSITPQSSAQQLGLATAAAETAFGSIVGALNVRFGNASLFAGAASDRAALSPAGDMLAAIRTALAVATTTGDVATVLDDWFDDPAGGFATIGYQGDTGAPVSRRIDSDTTVTVAARADDPGLRALLKATAMAAVAGEPGLLPGTQSALLIKARDALVALGDGVVGMQAGLGQIEERSERALAQHTASQTALGLIDNDLTAADPYATASRLQAVQQQLETHYTLTARLSGLSLVNYLR